MIEKCKIKTNDIIFQIFKWLEILFGQHMYDVTCDGVISIYGTSFIKSAFTKWFYNFLILCLIFAEFK